jgi:hypothetical protein
VSPLTRSLKEAWGKGLIGLIVFSPILYACQSFYYDMIFLSIAVFGKIKGFKGENIKKEMMGI